MNLSSMMESNSAVHCAGRVDQSTVDSWIRNLVWRPFRRVKISGDGTREEGGILDWFVRYGDVGFGYRGVGRVGSMSWATWRRRGTV
jgi:hypothetical protein